MNKETPRTDAEQWEFEHANLDKEMIVSADFARTLERELTEANGRIKVLEDALRPFAFFADQFERKPISQQHDHIYTIHAGSEYEATLRRSDCFTARAALAKEQA